MWLTSESSEPASDNESVSDDEQSSEEPSDDESSSEDDFDEQTSQYDDQPAAEGRQLADGK